MNPLSGLLARARTGETARLLGLGPPYPPVVLEMDQEEVSLVRIQRRRRGAPLLEAHVCRAMPGCVPASIFEPVRGSVEELAEGLRDVFERSGTRPGQVSMVLPDNLAKITLLQLPERPGSAKVLDEIVKGKMRRSVPFRLEEASLTYQVIPGENRSVGVLVVLVRRALVQRLEAALELCGARLGLVDICTPNLINLHRARLVEAAAAPGDTALINCARNYFSLVIFRKDRLIFFRCKTFGAADIGPAGPNGALSREVSNSFSYYREKLGGEGVRTVFVRSVHTPPEDLEAKLRELGCETLEPITPRASLALKDDRPLDPELGQRIAPSLGAALARGG